ncbi:hypothetical protein [Moorella sp. ACPs]
MEQVGIRKMKASLSRYIKRVKQRVWQALKANNLALLSEELPNGGMN